MDESPVWETIELEDGEFLSLDSDRVWPKYRVVWAIRRRSGDSDFPAASGFVEVMPPASGDLEGMWAELRDQAYSAAMAARSGQVEHGEVKKSLFGRLFRTR